MRIQRRHTLLEKKVKNKTIDNMDKNEGSSSSDDEKDFTIGVSHDLKIRKRILSELQRVDYNIDTAVPDMDDQMFELITGVIYKRPLTDASSSPLLDQKVKRFDNRRVQPEADFDDADKKRDLDKSSRALMKANRHRAPLTIEPELI